MSADCSLYLISPPTFELAGFSAALEDALSAGGVTSFQLRMKDADDETILAAGRALMAICHKYDVAFIVNDRADLAKELGADGVHLGQSDGSVADARDILGFDAAVGVTCHNLRHLAYEAGEAGADYVAFGAFFPTTTKPTEYEADPELLSNWSEIAEIPCVAIGGITPENCAILVSAGAQFLAVCSGIWDHPQGPAAAVKAFNKVIEETGSPA